MTEKIYEGSIRDELASNSGHSKKLINEFSKELFNCIREGLLNDGYVRLHQFGSFKLKWTDQRKGVNPITGEPLIIAAHPRILFNAAKHLKEQIPVSVQFKADFNNAPTSDLYKKIPDQELTENNSQQDQPRRTPLPKLEFEPYRRSNKISPATNSNRLFSFNAMVAGFLVISVLGYFIVTENSDITSRQIEQLPDIRPVLTETQQQLPVSSTKNAAQSNEALSITALKNKPADYTIDVKDNIKSDNQSNLQSHESVISLTSHPESDIEQPTQTTSVFFSAREYKLKDGNSLWRLSKKNYINPFYWPHIYQANRYTIHNPDKLRTGNTIHLPALYGHPDNLTAIDKHNIAEGYFLAYQYYRKTNKPYPYYALLGAIKYDPAIIEQHIFEIADEDWESLQLASN